MSEKSKIYTRTGDSGETSLFGGQRVPKNDQRIVTIGTIDELNALLGIVVFLTKSKKIRTKLDKIQGDLFSIGAELANPAGKSATRQDDIKFLEKNIDHMDESLDSLRNFILPGGNLAASHCQLARSVTRRAEREVLKLKTTVPVSSDLITYLNRLSDFLFVLARYLNKSTKTPEFIWKQSE